jgi:hypothetical protein
MRAVQSKNLPENLFMGRKLRVVSLAVKRRHEVLPVSVRVIETFKKCLQNISETWIKIP